MNLMIKNPYLIGEDFLLCNNKVLACVSKAGSNFGFHKTY